MAHDLFISYSTPDKAVADAVCATLEGRRLVISGSAQRTNPNLLPWEQAPADAQELTREMVRRIPVPLARVDLQVCRLGRVE